jgi:uncharacterized RDD family membrane protein YckC
MRKMPARPLTRIFADLFDWAIVYAFALVFSFRSLLALIEAFTHPSTANIATAWIDAFVSGSFVIIFIIVYFMVLPVNWNGQTIGRRFFKIHVVRRDGKPIDFQTIFVREVFGRLLVGIISLGASIVAEFFVLLASDRHQTFHDTLASTQVVDSE